MKIIEILDHMDSTEPGWLYSGPMCDALQEGSVKEALDHLDCCCDAIADLEFESSIDDSVADYDFIVEYVRAELEETA